MADLIVKLSMSGFLLWVIISGTASGAEIKIENRMGGAPIRICDRPNDPSIIRLQVQGGHKLGPPFYADTSDGNTPSYSPEGEHIAGGSDSVTYNASVTTYRVVIEMGSWTAGGLGGFVQRRYTHDSLNDGCGLWYRYLDFTVSDQGPGRLTLRVQPSGNQYQVVVQSGTATLSVVVPGQKTITDFTLNAGPYLPVNEKPALKPQRFTVAENSPISTVVGTLAAIDPDGGSLAYSITGGTGQGVFAVSPVTGQITVANSSRLDFETTPSLTLEVQVADNGTPSLSATATITINLTDVDEGVPVAPKNLRIR